MLFVGLGFICIEKNCELCFEKNVVKGYSCLLYGFFSC